MSSSLQTAVTTIQQNDYVTRTFIQTEGYANYSRRIIVSVLTAVAYDYGKYRNFVRIYFYWSNIYIASPHVLR